MGGHRHVVRSAAAAVAAILALGAAAGAAQASSYFHPSYLYRCTAYQALTNSFVYVDSYQFKSGHRYAVGYQKGYKLGGHIQSGRYKLHGNRISGISGPLAKAHESLLIQSHDLALLNRAGHLTGIGCTISKPGYKPPTPPPVKTNIPLGTYNCYYTTQNPGGGYSSAFLNELQLFGDGTYMWGYSPRYSSAWHQSGNSVVFTQGSLWSTYDHDVGTYNTSPVSMPNAQSNVASSGYTLVIKDTQQEGGMPPSVEWSATDGPGGSTSVPMSFAYCKQ